MRKYPPGFQKECDCNGNWPMLCYCSAICRGESQSLIQKDQLEEAAEWEELALVVGWIYLRSGRGL